LGGKQAIELSWRTVCCPARRLSLQRHDAVGVAVAVTSQHLVPSGPVRPLTLPTADLSCRIARVKMAVRRTARYGQKDKYGETYTKVVSMRLFHLADSRACATVYGVRTPKIVILVAADCHRTGRVRRDGEVQQIL
jgi:hypothetical protein